MPSDPRSSLTFTLLAISCGAPGPGTDAQPIEGSAPIGETAPTGPEPGATDPNGSTWATGSPTVIPTTVVGSSPAQSSGDANIGAMDELSTESAPTEAPAECLSSVNSDAQVQSMLAPYVLTDKASLPTRTLYTWTTPEQIEELKADPTLLTRSADSNGEKGRAADFFHAQADVDPLAALLDRPEYAKKRFGWIAPWATLLGWSGEDYGDRLLAITLKPDAWIATVVGYDALQWSFSDVDGNLVAEEDVLGNPRRLAAVYFIDQRDTGYCGGTVARAGSVFREFFVCNEDMIERWSAFTPELEAELQRNATALGAFRNSLDTARCQPWQQSTCHSQEVLARWMSPQEQLQTTFDLYFSSLAFPNALYAPTVTALDTLLDRLRLVPMDEEPVEHIYD